MCMSPTGSAADPTAPAPSPVEAFKALGHPVRWQIMQWLADPERHFNEYEPIADRVQVGVCVTHIQAKSGLAQSTVSGHLNTLERAGLIHSTRVGKWIHYRRDAAALTAVAHDLD